MEADADALAESFDAMTNSPDRINALARFAHRIGRLKSVPRAGWRHRGVSIAETESVADHSYRVAMLAWVASAGVEGLDRDRAIKLALLHDLAESLTGDLTPYEPETLDGLDASSRRAALNQRQAIAPDRKEAKRHAETEAISELTAGLPAAQREEVSSLWNELEQRTTPESRFVKQIDMVETYLQSREYLAAYPDLPMDSFAAEVEELITIPEVAALRDAIAWIPLERPNEGNYR